MCGLVDEILEDWDLISKSQNEWTDDTADLAIKLMYREEVIRIYYKESNERTRKDNNYV